MPTLDGMPGDVQGRRLGVGGLGAVLQKGGLQWFGHVRRGSDGGWVRRCVNFVVAGPAYKVAYKTSFFNKINDFMCFNIIK